MLNITGRSPEKRSDRPSTSEPDRNNLNIAIKGSRLPVAAFLLLAALIFAGCESGGTVGDGLGPDPDEARTTTYDVESISTVEANTFSGRLQNSAMGAFQDPLYGNLNAVSLLKPAITRAVVDEIGEDDTMSLKLTFRTPIYGDAGSVSRFEIYEVGERWRGNQLRYNSEVAVDLSAKVGEFEVADEDSIEVPLDNEWVQKFREFFNSEEANRDSLYRREFTGLAIVPVDDDSKIRFLRHSQDDDEDAPGITRFLVNSPNGNGENGDENGNGDDNGDENGNGSSSQFLDLIDWGSTVVRSDEPDFDDGFVLHNSERILQVDVDLPIEELSSKNIVNAKLVFVRDTEREEMTSAISRPAVTSLRGHSFQRTPSDLVSELFVNPSRFGSSLDQDNQLFSIDITQYILNYVFGDIEEGPIFVSLQTTNGILFSSDFYGSQASENLRPRIIITTVE
ncbi:MAG: DUF4270 domain-containing protein [Balneolaceae bacterium]|nr:DUF4270 domain-containing protein [Balneolaceae bacterium]